MNELHIAIALLGGFALVAAAFAGAQRRFPGRMPLMALVFGVLIGPVALGWLDPARIPHHHELLGEVARFTLALVMVGVGAQLPAAYFRHHAGGLLALFLVGTAFMCSVAAALAYAWLGMSPLVALLVGAVLTPTDPVLSAGATTGAVARESLPARLRRLLSAESALRHGLGMLFVMLPVLLLTRPAGEASWHWLTTTLLWEGVAAAVFGALVGGALGAAQAWSRRASQAGWGPLAPVLVAMAFAVPAASRLAGFDGLLAAFTAGVAYAAVRRREESAEALEEEHERHVALIKRALQVPVFVLLGVMIPWAGWAALGWPALGFVASLLVLRRLPMMLLVRPLVPALRNREEAAVAGWFGAIGVGGLLLALEARRHTGIEPVWALASLTVVVSVLAHDLTLTPFSRWLGARDGEGADGGDGDSGGGRPARGLSITRLDEPRHAGRTP